MANKKIVFTVTNDLSYDQRMSRICCSLVNAGYDVLLVGRKRKNSSSLIEKGYKQHRIFCFFEKGKLFYLEYNLRLFFFLIFSTFDIVCGIDLDTILPTFFAAKLKHKPFVYDAHEYFTEMEEVVARPMIKKAWQFIEKLTVPHVKYAYTVSQGYADMYKKKYNTNFELIKNATVLQELDEELIRDNVQYILYQGAVNVGRGLENLIIAMQAIDCQLYICGKGDIYQELKTLSTKMGVDEKVTFCGYVEPELLKSYTMRSAIGITFFSSKGLSNYYSLANRFSDYMHACVPQIAMKYPEYERFNQKHEIALLIDSLSAESITNSINKLLQDKTYYNRLKTNCKLARLEYNWQVEEKKLLDFYAKIVC